MPDNVPPAASSPEPATSRATDEDETSSDDDDNEPTVALGREKRANAGSRMAKLIELAGAEDELAEEEGYGEIFAEAANDDDFTEERHDDGDVDMSSSSEDEGEAQDEDAGEKELVKEERATGQKRKRETLLQQTMRLRRMKYPAELRGPATQRRKERREQATGEIQNDEQGEAPPPKKLKKSERVSWLLPPEAQPVRSSHRKLAIENKQQTIKRMKENQKRREKTLAAMQAAEQRKKARGERVLTQADRLAEAAEVERINRSSVNAWEESEKRRAEEQRARLAALKNRTIPGPVMTFWSGREICRDGKLILLRKRPLVTVVDEERRGIPKDPENVGQTADGNPEPEPLNQESTHAGAETAIREEAPLVAQDQSDAKMSGFESTADAVADNDQTHAGSLLDGMESWASLPGQPTDANTNEDMPAASKPADEPTEPTLHPPDEPHDLTEPNEPNGETTDEPRGEEPEIKLETDESAALRDAKEENDDPSTLEDADMSTLAARSLIILREFPRLPPANPSMRDRHAKARESTTRAYHRVDREGAPVIRALFTITPAPSDDAAYGPSPAAPAAAAAQQDPDAVPAAEYAGPYVPYDPLTPASSAPRHSTRYATKRATPCALTGAPSRYRDGATGLPFASARAYASIRRLMGRKARVSWSDTFQCWIDDRRPAAGVPRELWDGRVKKPKKVKEAAKAEAEAGEGVSPAADATESAGKSAGEAKADAPSKKPKATVKASPTRTTRSSKALPAPEPTRSAGTSRLRSASGSVKVPATKPTQTAAAGRSRRSTAGKK